MAHVWLSLFRSEGNCAILTCGLESWHFPTCSKLLELSVQHVLQIRLLYFLWMDQSVSFDIFIFAANHRATLPRDPADSHQQIWSQPHRPQEQGVFSFCCFD